MAVEWLTANEYAAVKHMHPQRVRELCAAGEIPAEKIGKSWRIPYAEPASFSAEGAIREAVTSVVEPCYEVIDTAMEALAAMRERLSEVKEDLIHEA